MSKLQIGREYVYDSTVSRVKTSGSYGIGNIAEGARECGAARLACVDFALASFYGGGVIPTVLAPALWQPADPDAALLQATFQNWTLFWAAHRRALGGWGSLHVGRPTSRQVEATAHFDASPGAEERVLVSLLNPSPAALAGDVDVPLYYAGLAPGAAVSLWRVWPGAAQRELVRSAVVGGDGGGVFDIRVGGGLLLPPRSYAFFAVTSP